MAFRALLTLALAIGALGVLSSGAKAQSSVCRQLESQLSALNTGRGSQSPRYQQYDRAVRDQRVQIQKTERAAQRNGCALFPNRGVCQRIYNSLDKMRDNLRSLEATRDQFAQRGPSGEAERTRIIRAMANNGCINQNRPQQVSVEPAPRRRTLLEQIFGVKTYSDRGSKEAEELTDPDFLSRFGTYRTLCVRTCDGYYFPISFSTTQAQFETDAQACSMMCPGTETALFVHRMPNEDAEEAISYRTGEAYASLPNAFSYREKLNPECSCRTANGGFVTVAGEEASPEAEEKEQVAASAVLPVPVWRQPAELDPDTVEARLGGFDAEALRKLVARKTLASGASGSGGEAGSRRIRVVGPAFFPVQ